jgi:ABC-type uncharacterized transport system permease subunit
MLIYLWVLMLHFSGCVAAYLAVNGVNPVVSLGAAIIVGALWGLLNGVLKLHLS